ncbi:M23 family metallopeptidase [Thalassotalea aquiviva]|uniref:M23 family metallopeptidase n=1 Tax=Thalassotalea aquiviva TaxID=3242415 RepID=UPI00352AC63C
MSLTVLYRGRNVRFTVKLAKPLWISIIASFALVSGLVVHWSLKPAVLPEYLQVAQQATMETNALNEIPSELSNEQITALTIKLADLQSHVLRLNALSERLAEEAEIPKEEFHLESSPSSGGPALEDAGLEFFSEQALTDQVNLLSEQIQQQDNQLNMLESLALGHHIQNNSYLSGRPIDEGWLSSNYGVRKDPFNGRPAMHKGVDFAGKEGANVIATGSGVVTWSGDRHGYGNLVEIDHGAGFKTRYGHNKALLVKVGDVVSKGQAIATMGSTGRSTGPHVHYEILRGDKHINPTKYVYRKSKN